jgi:hypothetical protein
MSSTRRINSSRANGARSRGPRTPEGKARSSVNAIRHGLLSKTTVLENEDEDSFQKLVGHYIERFSPVGQVDFDMIEEMTHSYWLLRRAWAIQTRMMDDAMRHQPARDELGRITAAFRELAAGPELALLHRYETSLHRMYQRSLHNLLLLRETDLPSGDGPAAEML